MKLKNPFTTIKTLEGQNANLHVRMENLYALVLALAKIMNVSPKLLQDYSQDKDALVKYLIKMGENVK